MILAVNGMAVAVDAEATPEFAATRELLRQRAVTAGLLEAGTDDEAAVDAAIEILLEREVAVPSPTEAECRRYYEGHPDEFLSGELVHVRHILFQVTSGVKVAELRARAEETLNGLLRAPEGFSEVARQWSNCPSGQHGGNLGQIARGDTVPEFEQVLFRPGSEGILHELVRTRHGFHIVAIDRRIPGRKVPFDRVRQHIAETLSVTVQERALRQYIRVLAGQAEIIGVDLGGADSPLVQ